MDNIDFLIAIPTYNRFEMLSNLIKNLKEMQEGYKIKIVVMDDCSDYTEQYINLCINYDCNLISNITNNGLKLYWKSINKILDYAKTINFKWLLQIDDDFEPTADFFNKFNNFVNDKKDDIIVKLHYPVGYNEVRWEMKHWVDGGAAYPISFLKKINFKIDEIPLSRWNKNPRLSDGVWHQLSVKLNNLKYTVALPETSLFNHLGIVESRMYNSAHTTPRLPTINFKP